VCLTLASLVALEACDEAANGQEAVERAQESSPDRHPGRTMPVMNGLDAPRQIRIFSPLTPILILTMHKSTQLMEEARRIGVQGYVVKAETREV
jgi:DNA-binding NarL/FixJ family response regulator